MIKKTPIAPLHPEEVRIGFDGLSANKYTWLWITLGLIIAISVGYYFYNKSQQVEETK